MLHHWIYNYFQSKSFVLKTSRAIMSYFSLAFGQSLWLVFDFHCSTWWIWINVDQIIPPKAKRNFCRCSHWKQQTQLCIHVSGKRLWHCPFFHIIWGKENKSQYLLMIAHNVYRVTDNLLTNNYYLLYRCWLKVFPPSNWTFWYNFKVTKHYKDSAKKAQIHQLFLFCPIWFVILFFSVYLSLYRFCSLAFYVLPICHFKVSSTYQAPLTSKYFSEYFLRARAFSFRNRVQFLKSRNLTWMPCYYLIHQPFSNFLTCLHKILEALRKYKLL